MHHQIEGADPTINRFFHYQSARSFKNQILMAKKLAKNKTENNNIKVTLDDGLKSQKTAAKILSELNIKGYFYYNSSNLTSNKVANVHLVHILLKILDIKKKRNLYLDLVNSSPVKIDFTKAQYIYRKQGSFSIDQKIKFIVNYILTNQEVDEILQFYYKENSTLPLQELNNLIYFSREELKELQNFGHHVLPHGHTHKILGKMTESQLNNEFSEMCDAHEYIFKTAVNELCVPYGSICSWSYDCERVAKSFGIQKIVMVDEIKMILKEFDRGLDYFSRVDCCLLSQYEYI